MLIALVVFGILVLVVPPALDRGTSRAARDELVFVHGLARTTAVQKARVAELHLEEDGPRFWIQVDTVGTGVYDTVAVRDLAGEHVAMTASRSVLCFDARGLATSRGGCDPPNATVIFSARGRSDTLRTSATGMILP